MKKPTGASLKLAAAALWVALPALAIAQALGAQPPATAASNATAADAANDTQVNFKPANWGEPPTVRDLGSYYPEMAVRERVNGDAKVHCTVTIAGALTDCQIVEESPPGYGFGVATIRVVERAHMNPARRDGIPVSSEITVPLSWRLH